MIPPTNQDPVLSRNEDLCQRYGVSFTTWTKRYAFLLKNKHNLHMNYFVSVPFCGNGCHFCDLPMEGAEVSDEYVSNVLWQMSFIKDDLHWGSHSYFWFGAGTVTTLSTPQFTRLTSPISENPKCIEADLKTCHKVFEWCKETSITTLSLGVQTLNTHTRRKFNIQRAFCDDIEKTIWETYNSCVKNEIRLNLDFICFDSDCSVTFEEILPFLGNRYIDISIYPHVSYFSSPDYEERIVRDHRYHLINTFMSECAYSQMSANGYYSLQPNQVLRRYFQSDYVVGIGKYGRIVPKTQCLDCGIGGGVDE